MKIRLPFVSGDGEGSYNFDRIWASTLASKQDVARRHPRQMVHPPNLSRTLRWEEGGFMFVGFRAPAGALKGLFFGDWKASPLSNPMPSPSWARATPRGRSGGSLTCPMKTDEKEGGGVVLHGCTVSNTCYNKRMHQTREAEFQVGA